VILLISLLVFMLVHAAPGDPADLLLSDEATKEDIDDARKRWGLDQPVYIQYAKFLWASLKGDLGTSFRYADPVLLMIVDRLPATVELAVVAILIALVLGVPLGVWAGARPNSWIDNFGSFFGFFGISMPNFWFGIMLILIVSGFLNLLPSAGRNTYGIAGDSITGFYILDSALQANWAAMWDGIKYIILPAVALGTNMMGILMRVTRSSVLEVMHEDYVRTARAKGLLEKIIINRHALKNALLPVVTVIGIEFAFLMGGLVVTEQVFNLNGLGKLFVESVSNNDYTLTQALVMLVVMIFVLTNFVVDLFYAWLDPRIRYS
jgi:peptide/nickel transport system permease protein